MRTTFSIALLLMAAVACNPKTEEKQTATATEKPAYAYSINKPDNWDIVSDPTNTSIAMNALKAFEDNKIDESASYFADTVHWRSDYMDMTVGKDSLKALFTDFRNGFTAFKVDMHDFESVISKDKKDAWVTLWYVEHFTDKTGKSDSMALINDLKIDKNKIVELNETVRHFPVKKP
ncbi:MAG: nuclear transport factor 2 family protein [Bacteroidota bacterium]|nr:nuclear transport factor 2 family protein [Bacteroidota bacterium]